MITTTRATWDSNPLSYSLQRSWSRVRWQFGHGDTSQAKTTKIFIDTRPNDVATVQKIMNGLLKLKYRFYIYESSLMKYEIINSSYMVLWYYGICYGIFTRSWDEKQTSTWEVWINSFISREYVISRHMDQITLNWISRANTVCRIDACNQNWMLLMKISNLFVILAWKRFFKITIFFITLKKCQFADKWLSCLIAIICLWFAWCV